MALAITARRTTTNAIRNITFIKHSRKVKDPGLKAFDITTNATIKQRNRIQNHSCDGPIYGLKSSFTDTAMLVTGKTLGQWFLLAIFGVALYLCFRIMQPFLMPIFLALILSTCWIRFLNHSPGGWATADSSRHWPFALVSPWR